MFTKKDLEQIAAKKIDISVIETQLENFKNGFPFVELVAPATTDSGIRTFNDQQEKGLVSLYENSVGSRSIIKFVPASGAASRMFKFLFEFREALKNKPAHQLLNEDKHKEARKFFDRIRDFAFIDDLTAVLEKNGYSLNKLLTDEKLDVILDYLLLPKGLNYSNLPKGLLKFHQYENSARMPVEEHMVEGAVYARDKEGNVPLHFTVSPEHEEEFIRRISEVRDAYEKHYDVNFQISYSEQLPSTDTIAVDMNNEPFREEDGSILFRPGGHGALINNLDRLNADVVFIKNIDNIVPDRLKEHTFHYKKVIGGLLISYQDKIFQYLERLENPDEKTIAEAYYFAQNELGLRISKNFKISQVDSWKTYLFDLLNRPIRICGMVINEGEPGGGPFWVKHSGGEVSLQIVEKSQIDLNNEKQKQILEQSTHFNPVDLVCGIKDYRGNLFNLKEFVDPATGFISVKSKGGQSLKAQELPGLWNGAMANWITIFVEVPIITFNPVKTINDLLRKEHQRN